ncbi:MAG: hypothetical protein ABSC36_00960 [Gaiellaceae bacterium]|jgi:hypothetical protein
MLVASVDVQARVALVLVVELGGGEASVTVGAGRTTRHVIEAFDEPERLVARTRNV